MREHPFAVEQIERGALQFCPCRKTTSARFVFCGQLDQRACLGIPLRHEQLCAVVSAALGRVTHGRCDVHDFANLRPAF